MKTIILTITVSVPDEAKQSELWDLARAAANGRLKSGLKEIGGQVVDWQVKEPVTAEGGGK